MDLQKALKSKSIIFGTEVVVKELRNGNIKNIFLSSNCPSDVKEMIEHYSKLAKVEVTQLDIPNDELGLVCKKPFSISVLGVKSG